MKAMLSDNFLIENQTELSINNLSEINKEVLRLLIAGKSVREIAEIINVSPKSVYYMRSKIIVNLGLTHLNEIFRKNICFDTLK
jgi:DNA-binding CsgD family transcriptional regulator